MMQLTKDNSGEIQIVTKEMVYSNSNSIEEGNLKSTTQITL